MAECAFCEIVTGHRPVHQVLKTDHVVAFLDQRPVFKGHTLVVPREHIRTLPEMPYRLLGPLFEQTQRLAQAMIDGLGSQGSFVALNNTVSQSVPHLHVHVVPRTKGDGLRGFFWPRTKYTDDADASSYAERIRSALPPPSRRPPAPE